MRYRTQRRLVGFAFLLPAAFLFLATVLYPFASLVYASFFQSSLFSGSRFVGLGNYAAMLASPQFHKSFGVTLLWTLGVVPLVMVLALGLALLLENRHERVRGLFRVIYFIPVVTNMVAAAFVWRWLFEPTNGVVNWAMNAFGLPSLGWLASTTWALPAMIVVGVWKQIGFALVIFVAGLKTIPRDLVEASRMDGARAWNEFRFITLPLLNPTIVFVLCILTINAFRVFTIPYVMSAGGFTYGTPGGPLDATRVLAIHIYDQGFRQHQTGAAAASAMALLVITVVLTLVQMKLTDRGARP